MKLLAAIGLFVWGCIVGYALALHTSGEIYVLLGIAGFALCGFCAHVLFREDY